jgi:hypothetical protein
MFGLSKYIMGGAGIALALTLAWGVRVDHLREGWKAKYETLSGEAGNLLYEIRVASGNDKLKWQDAPLAVRKVATLRDEWKKASEEQSKAIDRMAFDAAKMQKLNAELRAKAEVELRRRKQAYERLDASAADPGDRADCIAQIKAAEAALDAIYEAGL